MPDTSVKADIIYICSPDNPTGAAYSVERLRAWVDYARERGAVILYDAAYESFVSEKGLARSVYEVEGAKECAIEFCSFSKTAGFTGTRCGYTVVPFALKRCGMSLHAMWLRRQTTKFNGVAYAVQRGAAAALSEEGLRQIRANLSVYRNNAKIICDALDTLAYGTRRQKFAVRVAAMPGVLQTVLRFLIICWKRRAWSERRAADSAETAKGISA